ncbi:right-handed parallel beta-helix repeat-containing protein [Vallitalea pronyensis]|uniref:Right-handed parallel beta-helix repeat-containing protein n=1 Tax=Vallitalea pronyensis TaxID=1348613 RepID=A0A8J8SJG0_9FIRM|nr:right-handed parallel beta-helix repeat-containing protein [Vallitalea pronyensis]QUI25484.1 right-handed parallel beta-helix repeat-containing protein [Vallitalea pronyensis]
MAIKHVPSEFPTINEALANAKPCDTILIASGVFTNFGDTVIPANLNTIRIVGEGFDKTIIDGSACPDSVGITLSESSFITVESLTLKGFNDNGILVRSNNNIINNVRVMNTELPFANKDGIRIEGSYNMCINCQSMNNGADGIGVSGDNNYIIQCRVSNNNIDGIGISGSNNLMFGNIAENHTNSGDGIFSTDPSNIYINNIARLNSDDGIDLESNNNLLLFNVCSHNGNDGIEVSSNNIVWGNKVTENLNGIGTSSDDRSNIIDENMCTDNIENGMLIDGDSNIIDRNCMADNDETGIFLGSTSEDNCYRSNLIKNNGTNVIDKGTNNVMDSNIIKKPKKKKPCH